ncbi:MAG: adenylate/guanylate cyclase domain-containing protein [Acidimicrobiia bacterium]
MSTPGGGDGRAVPARPGRAPLTPLGVEGPVALRALVEHLGAPADEIDRAEADGSLGLLAVDLLVFPYPGRYTQDELLQLSGVSTDAPRFWRALGFPDPDPDDRVFTDADVELVRHVDRLLELRLVHIDVALQMTRVIGSAMARIASAQVDALTDELGPHAFGPPADGTVEMAEPALLRAGMLLPTMPKVLEYAWRRHLLAAARRRLVPQAGPAGDVGLVVGFADMVGFTAISQELDERQLAAVVGQFEQTAYDVVGGAGGRVIKTIGDSVMFAAAGPAAGVRTALALAEAYHADDATPDVRVGLAHGWVVQREGDLFGPTVNLASRLMSVAQPGTVVVPADLRKALAGADDLDFREISARNLKHIGRTELFVVRRAGTGRPRAG